MSSEINLALIGASGVVGKKIISLLEKKNIKVKNFYIQNIWTQAFPFFYPVNMN